MRLIRFLLKILTLPVMLLLKLFCLLITALANLSAYVLGPVSLFILGCGIYCMVKTRWMDAALLAGMEAVIFGAVSAAGWLTGMVEELCGHLAGFLHS
ncbi:MAG: hypothetical protein ACI4EG_14095 [Fusicatenibacter sp.]